MEIVAAPNAQGEIRLDSRALAERMGNEHASVMKLIAKNLSHFEQFGGVGFEIQTLETRGGRQEIKHAQLNEDQCYFLLTLVRNSETTVPMKAAVVAAFAKARQIIRDTPVQPSTPALVSLRLIGEALGCTAKSALNRISYRQIKASHHFFEPLCRAPAYLYPLEAVEAIWPAVQFTPFEGQVFEGVAPVAQAIAAQSAGKIARKHQPRLIPTDTETEQLARRLLSLEAQKREVLRQLGARA